MKLRDYLENCMPFLLFCTIIEVLIVMFVLIGIPVMFILGCAMIQRVFGG